MNRTLTMFKPDSMAAGNGGNILAYLEEKGFKVLGLRKIHLSKPQARAFYEVHKGRPFYSDLVEFMTSGPILAVALERDNAVIYLLEVMGSTNSEEAAEGTIRNLYGTNIERNAIHGSDSPENARQEIAFFFAAADLIG